MLPEKRKALAADLGEAMAQETLKSRGQNFSNAKRAYRRVVRKFNLALGIPLSEYTHTEGVKRCTIPFMKPRDVLQKLLADFSFVFFGGATRVSDAEALLRQFWQCYQREHPQHELFLGEGLQRLHRTFPMAVHGDGGRTQKAQPLEILSMQPVLGLDSMQSDVKTCQCEASKAYGGGCTASHMCQQLNSKHSTFMTHFLLFSYPSKRYRRFKSLLTSLLEVMLSDLADACEQGILAPDGTRWYPALIGFKCDMEWMAKIGSLVRSYQNVGTVNSIPCCHECDAGEDRIPFEDVNPGARWEQTRFRTIPWRARPPWSPVAFDSQQPAKFLRRDAFHIFRHGVGRNFLASVILLLLRMGCLPAFEL